VSVVVDRAGRQSHAHAQACPTVGLPRAQPAGIRLRGIQSLAVAKVAFATDGRTAPTANAGFRYRISPLLDPGRRTRLPQDATDVTAGVTMLPLSRRFNVGGHVQSGQLLRA
jgi:hypothetical protein